MKVVPWCARDISTLAALRVNVANTLGMAEKKLCWQIKQFFYDTDWRPIKMTVFFTLLYNWILN